MENGLLELQKNEGNNLQVVIARPGGVLPSNTMIPTVLIAATASIRVDTLGAAVVEEAVDGKESRTLDCAELRTLGGLALQKRSK